jgi:hypothetical protein
MNSKNISTFFVHDYFHSVQGFQRLLSKDMHDLAMWRAERLIRRSQMRAINLNLNVDLSISRSILIY